MKKYHRIQNLYYGLIAVFLILVQNSVAQNSPETDKSKGINRISASEYKDICINGITRTDIEATQGNSKQMASLFKLTFNITNDSIPDNTINFKQNEKGLFFSFVDLSDLGAKNQLEYFTISNNQSSFTIKGKTIKVGDNIGVLGDVNVDNRDGTISFSTWNESSFIEIQFDKQSKTITGIKYEVFT